MSVAYIGHSQAKEGESEEFREFLTSVVAPAVQASQGCESCQVFQSQEEPTKFVVVEVWTSVEAHRASVKTIPASSIEAFMKLVAGPPSGGYYHA